MRAGIHRGAARARVTMDARFRGYDERRKACGRTTVEIGSPDMNDPHVVSLVYAVRHGPNVNYDKALPLTFSAQDFSVIVENERAVFSMLQHFTSEQDARSVVEPFIETWQLSADLERDPDAFALEFHGAEIVDRNPLPGHVSVPVGRLSMTGHPVTVVTGYRTYPAPPNGLALNATVSWLHRKVTRYRKGQESLPSTVYACVQGLEHAAGGAHLVSRRFRVSARVISELNKLSSERGGLDARKAKGIGKPYTDQEIKWIDAALRKLIRRVAEIAADPNSDLPKITMGDLPPLDSTVAASVRSPTS